jgi:iron(III) transport system substrate-binding protein
MLVPRARTTITLILFVLIAVEVMLLPACQSKIRPEVVIYASVDQIYSEPILKKFETESGITVLPVFDVEATKTTGMVNRLIAEKARPQTDVFWSGEFAQTILLKEEGILSAYNSLHAATIPTQYRDPDNYWTGFAGRARVLLINTNLLPAQNYPHSLFDLIEPPYRPEQIGIAYPMFGTTATHAAALYAALGDDKARAFFDKVRQRGIRIVDGNATVRDMVASGQLSIGLTDTDDACGALKNKAPVKVIFPDQNGIGTFIIPNTVALINNAPRKDNAKKLIDFLLSTEVENLLMESGWSHLALRPTNVKPQLLETANIKGMAVNLIDVYSKLEIAKRDMSQIFIR